MRLNPTIVLGYIGVHQIFQLALAAHESGSLERLHCSLINGSTKWGRYLSGWVAAQSLSPLGGERLPEDRISEIPLPLLSRQLSRFRLRKGSQDYYCSNSWFDRILASRLQRSKASVFVGVETCALTSLQSAREAGMKRILDCPGIPADLLDVELRHACEELKLSISFQRPSERMTVRREIDPLREVRCNHPPRVTQEGQASDRLLWSKKCSLICLAEYPIALFADSFSGH